MNNFLLYYQFVSVLLFFNLSFAVDRSSLGQLATLPDELFQDVALHLIKTIGTPEITNHADVPVIAKNLKNFSLVNKYLFTFLNNEKNTFEFIKALSARFKYSQSQAAYYLNTPRSHSITFQSLKETGEYDVFLAVHNFHKNLKRQHSEITELVTFVPYDKPIKKIKLDLSPNQRRLTTPWGDVDLLGSSFPSYYHIHYHSNYNLRSSGKLALIKNTIETLFTEHCEKFKKENARNSLNDSNYAWKLMLLNTPELRDNYLPFVINEKEKEIKRRIHLPSVETLPQWALTIFQKFANPMFDPDNNAIYLSLKKSPLHNVFFFLHRYANEAHLQHKSMIASMSKELRLYNKESLNVGSVYAAYVTISEYIRDGWNELHLADKTRFFSLLDIYSNQLPVFSEEERFIITKEIEHPIKLADLIRNLAEYYGLNKYISVGTTSQSALLSRRRSTYVYCWIEKNSFPEVFEKFGFSIIDPRQKIATNALQSIGLS